MIRIAGSRTADWPVVLLIAGLLAASPGPCRAADVFLIEDNLATKMTFTMDYVVAGTPDRLAMGASYTSVVTPSFTTPDGAFTISWSVSASNMGGVAFSQSMAANVTDSAGVMGSISLRYQQDYELSPLAIGPYMVTSTLVGGFTETVPPAFPHGNDIKANATLEEPGAANQSTRLLEGIDSNTGPGPWTVGPVTDFNFLAPESVKLNQTFDFDGTPAMGDLSQTPFTVSVNSVPEPSTLIPTGIALAIGLLAAVRRRLRGPITTVR
jgi:hypothetical protein